MRVSFRDIFSEDIADIQDYWLNPANLPQHLARGAELKHIQRLIGQWSVLEKQVATPPAERTSTTAIILLDGKPVGHTLLNFIDNPEKRRVHLHIWRDRIPLTDIAAPQRLLTTAIPGALRYFFENYGVDVLIGDVAVRNHFFNAVLQRLGYTPNETVQTQYLSSSPEPYYRYVFKRHADGMNANENTPNLLNVESGKSLS